MRTESLDGISEGKAGPLERLRRVAAFNVRHRNQWVAKVAASLPPGTRVLDVGAGQCKYRLLFAHCHYEAQDFAEYEGTEHGVFAEEWRYGALDYICDIAAIPVEDASFDVVICTEVLEHVPDPVAALREIARVLRPNGRAYITAPLGSGLHQEPFHYYGGFTPHFYQRFLHENGFEAVEVHPNGGLFRHLLQELIRADAILWRRPRYRLNPLYWVVRAAVLVVGVPWLSRLDDRVPVPEFTVGFHVTARKRSAGSPRLLPISNEDAVEHEQVP